MKSINLYILVAILIIAACKDKEENRPLTGTINVINANIDAVNAKVNPGTKNSWRNISEQVAYGNSRFYYANAGMVNLIAVSSADTTKTLFNQSLVIKPVVCTLYLSGTAAQPDTMFREEVNFPFIRTDQVKAPSADSVVNVRFVNLSVGSPALKVKIATATGNEVDNLPYKGIGEWKRYSAKLTSTSYSFQIRNASTDALITTYSFVANNNNRFRNVALVIRGVFGTTTGTTPFGVSTINYY